MERTKSLSLDHYLWLSFSRNIRTMKQKGLVPNDSSHQKIVFLHQPDLCIYAISPKMPQRKHLTSVRTCRCLSSFHVYWFPTENLRYPQLSVASHRKVDISHTNIILASDDRPEYIRGCEFNEMAKGLTRCKTCVKVLTCVMSSKFNNIIFIITYLWRPKNSISGCLISSSFLDCLSCKKFC